MAFIFCQLTLTKNLEVIVKFVIMVNKKTVNSSIFKKLLLDMDLPKTVLVPNRNNSYLLTDKSGLHREHIPY